VVNKMADIVKIHGVIILNKAFKDHRLAIALCSLFAFFTEVLQLFFERSGRLVDVFIYIDGIYTAERLSEYIKTHGGIIPAISTATKKLYNVSKDDNTP
jgi:hypothetical protein